MGVWGQAGVGGETQEGDGELRSPANVQDKSVQGRVPSLCLTRGTCKDCTQQPLQVTAATSNTTLLLQLSHSVVADSL